MTSNLTVGPYSSKFITKNKKKNELSSNIHLVSLNKCVLVSGDMLFNTPSSMSASIVSFGQKKMQVNIESRSFSKNDFFPEHKKVPDGFKFNKNMKMSAPERIDKKGNLTKEYDLKIDQITLIDRHNDEKLKEIKKDFSKELKFWNYELSEVGKMSKIDKDDYIVLGAVDYVRKLRKSFIYQDSSLEKNTKEDLAGKESYLGDVFASRANVCRHNSFLMKMLLEDQIPLGVQAGYIIAPEGSGFHCWNVYKNKEEKIYEPIDVTFDKGKCWYFDYSGKPLYTENMSPKQQLEFDVLSMQVGDELFIGFDEDNNVVTNKTDKNADFVYRLRLPAYDSLDVATIGKYEESPYDFTLDENNSVIFYNKETNEKVFDFNFTSLVLFLKLRLAADSIKVSKLLNIPMVGGKNDYESLLKQKDAYFKVDPTINKEMIDSIPDIFALR